MTRTSKRAIRPGFDDLEGRQLLSTSPAVGPSAPAITIPYSYYYFRNEATGYYLYGSGPHVYGRPYNGGANERWDLLSSGDGYYYLRNEATGDYLYSSDQIGVSDQPVGERPPGTVANERYELWDISSYYTDSRNFVRSVC